MPPWKKTLWKLRLLSGAICLTQMQCFFGLALYLTGLLIDNKILFYGGLALTLVMMLMCLPLVKKYAVIWYRLYDEVTDNPDPVAKSWLKHMERERTCVR